MIGSNEVKFTQVEETMRAIAAERPMLDAMAWSWYNEAAKRLNVSSESGTPWVSASWIRFQGQALRALKKLAAEGVLVKYGQNLHTGFRTSAAQAQIDEEQGRKAAARKAYNDRFDAVRARLAALGLTDSIILSADEWERLLAWAEAGKAEARAVSGS
jgi:hypothetical protein